jgi:hypothetical protein
MKVRCSVELLLPSIQFGNVKVISDITVSSEDGFSDVTTKARELALQELLDMKQAINELEAGVFSLNVKK